MPVAAPTPIRAKNISSSMEYRARIFCTIRSEINAQCGLIALSCSRSSGVRVTGCSVAATCGSCSGRVTPAGTDT